ncbi:ABC transporter substrate-binding protein [Streptomyces pristinaespiralis]|uniref:Peptide ABC transporter substrate-binding protein n=1 Tax=Streptomyces pristinaespiralis TaxID=38300 RepID=A0A0M4DYB7_STRPR|nr:ABC transporter substrate-binding protein [Streptomyces pristinaespiralis]ALC24632.1 peptide ABC transporter substrate-binding protein [Streptomyces pristinaespiralis]QMU13035.1 ABC transporter substrate-binding protein [Streptomyces pristinaespiralis]
MSERRPAGVERRTFLRYTSAIGVATAITAGLSACGGPASTGGDGGAAASDGTGTIEAGLSYALSTGFDPMITSGATPYAANMHIFEGLVDLDPATLVARPALATGMPQKINATTYRATLRKGATFHDGSPVTADDVVFSFQRVLDPKNASLMAQFVPFVDKVTAVDPATVEFKLKYPFALFPSRISVVRIVPEKIAGADAKAFDAKPVGTGPYRFVSATREDKIVFEAYDKYNGPRPAKAKKMIWRLMSDPSARVSAMQSGRVQAIEDVPYIDIKGLEAKHRVESVQSFGLLFLMFNTADKRFADKRVRQALHYALDTEKIISTALVGNASPATGYVPTTHPDYHKAATIYTRDVAKAKKLLADAGVKDLSFTVLTTDTGWVKDVAPMLQESWEAAGIKVRLDIAQSPAQYAKVDKGDFEVLVAPGDPSVFGNDADLLLRWFYYGFWPEKRYGWSGSAAYKQVKSLLDKAAQAADEATRKQLWGQVTDLLADEAALYPILHRKLPTAWDEKALPGFKPLPTTGLSFVDVGRA